MKLPYAEDVNYFQTGKSSPDKWIDDAKREIIAIGGKVHGWAFGSENQSGRSAYMLEFELEGERFKIVWPVLPTRSGRNEAAARIQAATFLYHEIKARCMTAKIIGKRASFFSYLLLPDGRSAASATMDELTQHLPEMFKPKLIAVKE